MAAFNGRWQWSVRPEDQLQKRPRNCKYLNEVLLEFPDPDSLKGRSEYSSASSKQEDTLKCLTERHWEQRRRLVERHTAEYRKWTKDVEEQIDIATLGSDRIQLNILSESNEVIKSKTARKALELLPMAARTIFVSTDQLEDTPTDDSVSPVELAAEIGRQAVEYRMHMLNEEQQLRMFQHESRALFYEAMMRSNPEKYPKDLRIRQPTIRPPQTSIVQGETATCKGPPIFTSKAVLGPEKNNDPPRDPRLHKRN